MKIKNASQAPKRYFGLHMVEGVAEYPEHKLDDGSPTRILVLENALKAMDPSFEGLPVYVHHVDDVDLANLQRDADGYVVRSFFNKLDGKHWAEFLVVSDRGHEAISKGWRLSNAYTIHDSAAGGKWHAVDYAREVTNAEYQHLALVPNPRYEESVIYTPEEFKDYNTRKESELRVLANAAPKENRSMFNFLKKTKLENADEIANAVVTLSDGSERTVAQLINEAEGKIKKDADDVGEKKNTDEDEEEKKKKAEADKKNAEDEAAAKLKAEADKKNAEDEEAAKKKAEEDKMNAEAEAKKKEDEEKKMNSVAHFNALKNAADQAKPVVIETSTDKVARGQARYGSKK